MLKRSSGLFRLKYFVRSTTINGKETRSGRILFRKSRKIFPLLASCFMIVWAACSQSNVNGYVVAFFVAVIVGASFAKDDKAYGAAIIKVDPGDGGSGPEEVSVIK